MVMMRLAFAFATIALIFLWKKCFIRMIWAIIFSFLRQLHTSTNYLYDTHFEHLLIFDVTFCSNVNFVDFFFICKNCCNIDKSNLAYWWFAVFSNYFSKQTQSVLFMSFITLLSFVFVVSVNIYWASEINQYCCNGHIELGQRYFFIECAFRFNIVFGLNFPMGMLLVR